MNKLFKNRRRNVKCDKIIRLYHNVITREYNKKK